MYIFFALSEVSLTEEGRRPVTSVISLVIVSGSNQINAYLSLVSLLIALGTFMVL